VDPFLQAVVGYPGRLDTMTQGTAPLLYRSERFDIGEMVSQAPGSFTYHDGNGTTVDLTTAFYLYPDIGMGATSLVGFVNSSTSAASVEQAPPLICPTGNCTWPLYASLEICSSCADISSAVQKISEVGNPAVCSSGGGAGAGLSFSNMTNYTLQYGLTHTRKVSNVTVDGFDGYTSIKGNPEMSGDCSSLRSTKHQVAVGAVFQPNQTHSFQDYDMLLASFAILRPTDDYYNNNTAFEDNAVEATECALRFCAQVHNSSVQGGHFVDQVLPGTDFERSADSFQLTDSAALRVQSSLDADYGNSLTLAGEANVWGILQRTDLQLFLPPNVTESSSQEFNNLAMPDGQVQQVLNISQRAIETMMYYWGHWDSLNDAQSQPLTDLGNAVADSTNLTATFENAALTMTNRMRQMDTTPLVGNALQWDIYISVRWQFLALPALAYVATLIFSIVTVIVSRRTKVDVLKGNMLEVLTHGLNDVSRAGLRRQQDRKRAAERMPVQLVGEEEAMELSGNVKGRGWT
jgi:hypothetical protein